jgi:hypothetical protein
MRCVDEIRADGVATVPVADGAPTLTASDSRTLSASLPQSQLQRVNACLQGGWKLYEGQHRSNRAAAVHQPKNAWGLGRSPKVSARAARVLFLSLPVID